MDILAEPTVFFEEMIDISVNPWQLLLSTLKSPTRNNSLFRINKINKLSIVKLAQPVLGWVFVEEMIDISVNTW